MRSGITPELPQQAASNQQERLINLITPLVEPLGYEIIFLEVHTHRQKTLRLFIEHREQSAGAIGVEDCVKVSRALDEPLDLLPEIDAIFHGPYELEVSSPGVDRPLRNLRDFARFIGREARIHVFRPLAAAELENETFASKHPKQKNFLGSIRGVRGDKVLMALVKDDGSKPGKKGKAPKKAKPNTNSVEDVALGPQVAIPLPLISKANLEPSFDLTGEEEGIEL